MIRDWLVRAFEVAVTAALVTVVAALALRLYFAVVWQPETVADDHVPRPPTIAEELVVRASLERIEAAVHVHRLRTGQLPSSLNELVLSGLLDPESVVAPNSDDPFYYTAEGDTFVLHPPIVHPAGRLSALRP